MVEETFDLQTQSAADTLIGLALSEDLAMAGDLTCAALIQLEEVGEVQVVSRASGVLAGSPVGRMVFAKLDPLVRWEAHHRDGARVEPGTVVATVTGPLRSLLTGERAMLNFLTHLSGVASITQRFVEAVRGSRAKVLDTRKTLPGWRLLEKYAVRCGGGTNHRMGLYDGILIKDNHLAAWTDGKPLAVSAKTRSIAAAVQCARRLHPTAISIEVEVDTLDQLLDALNGQPDIVLLDNMNPELLRKAVALRDRCAPDVLLEASGGVTLATVAEIAQTGVERISVGALTHSAPALDLAFDWKSRIDGENR
jgi:nicotinate-nucleotide pyrophosphorylase (carboxylating)